MGKRKRAKAPRPWCWYCERDFDDDGALATHQRAKHFKCDECNKKMTTIGGLCIHARQVHKVEISRIANALPERASNLEIEIFGMVGIPAEDLAAYEAKKGFGNAAKNAHVSSSETFEELTPEQLLAQLAQHKAASSNTSSPTVAAPPSVASPSATVSVASQAAPVIAAAPVPSAYPGYGYDTPYNPNGYYPYPAQGQRYAPAPPYAGWAQPPSSYGAPPPHGALPPSDTTAPTAPAPAAPAHSKAPSSSPTANSASTHENTKASSTASTSAATSPTVASTAAISVPVTTTKKKPVLIYNNKEMSPEEQRAEFEKQRVKSG